MVLSRGFAAAFVCLLAAMTLPTPVRAAVSEVPRLPPSTDLRLDGLSAHVVWDPALDNRFGWRFAQSQIPTACNDVRAGFPARVAMMTCALEDAAAGRAAARRAFAFSGGGSGGGAGGATILSQPIQPVPSDDLVPIPLPAGVLLFGTALGGLMVARRAARRG